MLDRGRGCPNPVLGHSQLLIQPHGVCEGGQKNPKLSISGVADGYYRLKPGDVCAEPHAGRMFEARCNILPRGFLLGHNSWAIWSHPWAGSAWGQGSR